MKRFSAQKTREIENKKKFDAKKSDFQLKDNKVEGNKLWFAYNPVPKKILLILFTDNDC